MSSSSPRPNTRTDSWTQRELLWALQADVAGIAVVTSTERAARTLRQHYIRLQRANGNSGWRTPQILAWEPWLATLWNAAVIHGIESRLLLSEVQELEIWQSVLAGDETALPTISRASLAELAQSAYRQLHQFRVPLNRLRNDGTLDVASFYRWSTEFEKICRKTSMLPPARMEESIAEWISAPAIPIQEKVFLVGFDRITPLQTFLIATLQQRGCSATLVELMPPRDNAWSEHTIVYAETAEEEIAAAAYWIRERLLANPIQQIGVIVSSLEKTQYSIDAAFRRILAPSTMDTRVQDPSPPYEFSLGTAMNRLQPIQTALALLRWLIRGLDSDEVSRLLVHGSFSEPVGMSREARAKLDQKFCERSCQLGGPVSFASFRQWLSKSENSESAAFRQTIERLARSATRLRLDRLHRFTEWREIIEELLGAAEWHLLQPARSADFQLLRRWNSLLNDFSSLNSVAGTVTFSTAVEKLGHLAAHMLFTQQTRNAPVQIVGASESSGLVFDAIWWINARIGSWPPQGKAQPLLPWALQREAHMPYADPAEDYAFALRATKRMLSSASTLVVSFALQECDQANSSTHIPDSEILLTPLVREVLPGVPIVAVEQVLATGQRFKSSGKGSNFENNLEEVQEEPAVPFQAVQVQGGVKFLEFQAACPFRAFAELRLGARPLEDPSIGISPGDQGDIVHRVLDEFWKEMKSRTELLEKAPAQHRQMLREYIHKTIATLFPLAEEPWQQTLLSIESERLEQRLMEWLEQEKLRPEFTVIGTEKALDTPQLGGISLRCRVDRIDQVAQGIVLLDYKTGRVDRHSCEGERPDLPQLPAYAVLGNYGSSENEQLAGVAFAGLHPRDVGFTVVGSLPGVFQPSSSASVGTAESTSLRPKSPKSKLDSTALTVEQMRQLKDAWSESLNRLAEEFRAGAAKVDPKKHEETCRYCAQTLLCRIRETAANSLSAAEAEDPANNMADDGPQT